MPKIFRKIPLKSLGDLTTTIFMGASFLSAHTAEAAGNEQKCHKEQEHAGGKDRANQNPQSQPQGAQAQKPAGTHCFLASSSLVWYHYIQRGGGGCGGWGCRVPQRAAATGPPGLGAKRTEASKLPVRQDSYFRPGPHTLKAKIPEKHKESRRYL